MKLEKKLYQKRPPHVRRYNSWRIRILYSIIIGYATFYLCRQNFNIAMPALMDHFHISKTQFGWILSSASIVYGVGKFCNGFISDKSNARIFIVSGIGISSLITFFSGFATSINILGFLWIANHWVQSMGWPPIARMLTHWFSPREWGTKWAMGSASIQIGGAITMVLCGYLIENYSWQSAFFVPGIIGIVVSLFLFNRLRDSPNDVDLPMVEEYKEEKIYPTISDNLSLSELFNIVFANKSMWYIGMANMCLYIVRLGVIFWAPMFLRELKGMTLSQAGWQVAAYEVLGIAGAISAGWVSDKIFHGQRGPVGFGFMIALAAMLIIFWLMPNDCEIMSICIMSLTGFFVYGPQILIGVASADITSKKAIGTANGLISIFGNIGAALAGVCVGFIVDTLGWNGVFVFFICSAILGAGFFALTWYEQRNNSTA